jgi:hypothetical protein
MRAGAFVATMQGVADRTASRKLFRHAKAAYRNLLVAVATGGFEVLVSCALKFN